MSDTVTPDTTPVDTSTPEAVDPPLGESKKYDESYVKELRSENAGLRVGKREAVEAAVKTANEAHQAELVARDLRYTELENELGNAWIELEKVYCSIDAKVPSDKVRQFVSILNGNDREAIEQSAKNSIEIFGGFDTRTPAFDPTQGFGGKKKDVPLNGDPILEAIKRAVGAS